MVENKAAGSGPRADAQGMGIAAVGQDGSRNARAFADCRGCFPNRIAAKKVVAPPAAERAALALRTGLFPGIFRDPLHVREIMQDFGRKPLRGLIERLDRRSVTARAGDAVEAVAAIGTVHGNISR